MGVRRAFLSDRFRDEFPEVSLEQLCLCFFVPVGALMSGEYDYERMGLRLIIEHPSFPGSADEAHEESWDNLSEAAQVSYDPRTHA